jgi:LPXTG-motif cell wall-anchored protein
MFSVRHLSPRVLTILTVAGLGLIGLVATATPASAHTADGSRDCTSVTVNFSLFSDKSTEADPNRVHVTMKTDSGAVVLDTESASPHGSWSQSWDLVANGTLHVDTSWQSTGHDNATGSKPFRLYAKRGCHNPPPPPKCQGFGQFDYTFDGASGDASVTLRGELPLCKPVTVLLASFKTQGPTWETSGHQTVFDQMSQVITEAKTYQLHVKVPDCFTQVDLYVTDKKAVDFDFPNDTLGEFLAQNRKRFPNFHGGSSAFNGGTTGCMTETETPTPTPTTPSPTPSTPTATPTTVSPTSAVPPAAAPPGTALPNTGASPFPKILLALVLLGAGTGLAFLGRRRRRAAG